MTPERLTTCLITGCNKPSHARGWCRPHYCRWLRHGDPLGGGTSPGAPLAWLNAHVEWQGEDCLIWPFGRHSNGYALLGGYRRAHRLMCEMAHGEPPSPKHEAAHSCGKGHLGCIHPQHLRWATHAENEADKITHGTIAFGERHASAKLTTEQVLAIRADQRSQRTIAATYGIDQAQVSNIKRRKRWTHV